MSSFRFCAPFLAFFVPAASGKGVSVWLLFVENYVTVRRVARSGSLDRLGIPRLGAGRGGVCCFFLKKKRREKKKELE